MEKEYLPEGMLIIIKGLLKGLIYKELPISERDAIDLVFERFYDENVRKYSPHVLKERFSTAEDCVKHFLEYIESQKEEPSKPRIIETQLNL